MRLPGKVAVITGGADGMGKALAIRLASENCSVALCDISSAKLETALCEVEAAALEAGTEVVVSAHVCDVRKERECNELAHAVAARHQLSGRGLLVFNNAGASVANSMIVDSREAWDDTFSICWGGVYLMTRAFMPLLLAAPEGYLVNTSSINGIWPCVGLLSPHTAYSAAKFAVKGFTEALIDDFRLHAPHIKVACVIPGHVGTNIAANSISLSGSNPQKVRENSAKRAIRLKDMTAAGDPAVKDHQKMIKGMLASSDAVSKATDEQLLKYNERFAEGFRNHGVTPLQAADIILDGVRQDRWRILVGDDAVVLDKIVRSQPVEAIENPLMVMQEMSRAKQHIRPVTSRETAQSKL